MTLPSQMVLLFFTQTMESSVIISSSLSKNHNICHQNKWSHQMHLNQHPCHPFHYSLLYLHPLWCSRHLLFHLHFFLILFFIFVIVSIIKAFSLFSLIIIFTLVIFLITYTFLHIVRESVIQASKFFLLVIFFILVFFLSHTSSFP